jgi:hypothetical protein
MWNFDKVEIKASTTGISTEFHGHLNGETMMKNLEEP